MSSVPQSSNPDGGNPPSSTSDVLASVSAAVQHHLAAGEGKPDPAKSKPGEFTPPPGSARFVCGDPAPSSGQPPAKDTIVSRSGIPRPADEHPHSGARVVNLSNGQQPAGDAGASSAAPKSPSWGKPPAPARPRGPEDTQPDLQPLSPLRHVGPASSSAATPKDVVAPVKPDSSEDDPFAGPAAMPPKPPAAPPMSSPAPAVHTDTGHRRTGDEPTAVAPGVAAWHGAHGHGTTDAEREELARRGAEFPAAQLRDDDSDQPPLFYRLLDAWHGAEIGAKFMFIFVPAAVLFLVLYGLFYRPPQIQSFPEIKAPARTNTTSAASAKPLAFSELAKLDDSKRTALPKTELGAKPASAALSTATPVPSSKEAAKPKDDPKAETKPITPKPDKPPDQPKPADPTPTPPLQQTPAPARSSVPTEAATALRVHPGPQQKPEVELVPINPKDLEELIRRVAREEFDRGIKALKAESARSLNDPKALPSASIPGASLADVVTLNEFNEFRAKLKRELDARTLVPVTSDEPDGKGGSKRRTIYRPIASQVEDLTATQRSNVTRMNLLEQCNDQIVARQIELEQRTAKLHDALVKAIEARSNIGTAPPAPAQPVRTGR